MDRLKKDIYTDVEVNPPRLPRHKGDKLSDIPKRCRSKPLSRKERAEIDEEICRSALLEKDPPIQDKEEYVKPPDNKFHISNKSGTYMFFNKSYCAHILELKDSFIDGRHSNLSKVLARQHEFISYEIVRSQIPSNKSLH